MRGYFALGVEGISKPRNLGAVLRTAHAFGASFTFAVAPVADLDPVSTTDTSDAASSIPFYAVPALDRLMLPKGCRLVAVELHDQAVELPSFRHPLKAAYILGPEQGGLSPAVMDRADFVVRIPTRFSINLSLAGALVLYDRMISRGRFADRPVAPGGPAEPLAPPVRGLPRYLRRRLDPAVAEEV